MHERVSLVGATIFAHFALAVTLAVFGVAVILAVCEDAEEKGALQLP